MKEGKCADAENISAEHILHGPLPLFERFVVLFNAMLLHSFVPRQFSLDIMISIVKNNQESKADVGNYRGITISPTPSKLFEHVLKVVFHKYLMTSKYQFDFKRNSSTVNAIFCLKVTMNYYIENGSSVHCAFLDASKAFDRLVHSGLFIKLIERKVPKVFLDLIIYWYDGLICQVKWDNQYSDWFAVKAGVCQGGVLSPDFYSIYVDDLVAILQKSNIGCYIRGKFAAALFYADDMAIMSPSIRGLQRLLDICDNYCREWDICLNSKKTKCMFFGKKTVPSHKLVLQGSPIEWAENWDYLGVNLKSGKRFGCSVAERLKKFYKCLNSILRIDGRSNDMIMLRLLETHCVPLLTYGIEVVHIADSREKSKIRAAYNSIFRKLFDYRTYQSVTQLQAFLNRPTWEQLVEKRKRSFSLRTRQNSSDSLLSEFV